MGRPGKACISKTDVVGQRNPKSSDLRKRVNARLSVNGPKELNPGKASTKLNEGFGEGDGLDSR